jgi:hypothetical protein
MEFGPDTVAELLVASADAEGRVRDGARAVLADIEGQWEVAAVASRAVPRLLAQGPLGHGIIERLGPGVVPALEQYCAAGGPHAVVAVELLASFAADAAADALARLQQQAAPEVQRAATRRLVRRRDRRALVGLRAWFPDALQGWSAAAVTDAISLVQDEGDGSLLPNLVTGLTRMHRSWRPKLQRALAALDPNWRDRPEVSALVPRLAPRLVRAENPYRTPKEGASGHTESEFAGYQNWEEKEDERLVSDATMLAAIAGPSRLEPLVRAVAEVRAPAQAGILAALELVDEDWAARAESRQSIGCLLAALSTDPPGTAVERLATEGERESRRSIDLEWGCYQRTWERGRTQWHSILAGVIANVARAHSEPALLVRAYLRYPAPSLLSALESLPGSWLSDEIAALIIGILDQGILSAQMGAILFKPYKGDQLRLIPFDPV